MKGMWKIARWELMRNLTNKQFIIGLFITPLIMALFAGVPLLLDRLNHPALSTYYVIDELGALQHLQAIVPDSIALEPYANPSAAAERSREQTPAAILS